MIKDALLERRNSTGARVRCFFIGRLGERDRVPAIAAVVERLGYSIARLPDIVTLQADQRFQDASRSVVVLTEDRDLPAAIEFANDEGGRTFVICLADTIAPNLYKELVRTRSGEWVTWANAVEEVPELLAGLMAAGVRRPGGKVVSFAASKGGVGNTTLVLETAIHLVSRRRAGSRIAVLDLNLQGGTLADTLDVESRFDVAEIAGRPERLDEQLIDVFTSRHASGLHVFANPGRPGGADDLDPQIVFAFIDGLAARYGAVLLDMPHVRLPWTDDLLRGSDAIVVAGGGTVPALRRLTAKLAHLDGHGIPENRVAAVVNHCGTDLLGRVSHRAEIERALAGRRTFFVRRDWDGVGGTSNGGGSLMELMPNSRVARDIRRLAGWVESLVERQAQTPPPADLKDVA